MFFFLFSHFFSFSFKIFCLLPSPEKAVRSTASRCGLRAAALVPLKGGEMCVSCRNSRLRVLTAPPDESGGQAFGGAARVPGSSSDGLSWSAEMYKHQGDFVMSGP